jgi:hypothetical protein
MKPELAKEDNRRIASSYKDSWLKTIAKVPYKKLAADATISLASSKITGMVIQASPEMQWAAGMAVERLLLFTIHRFTHIYESGEASLSEVFGRTIPEKRYSGVNHFWASVHADGWDKLKPADKPIIEITGVLSPFGPLTPAHPKSKPGYSLKGWDVMGNLGVESTEDYDMQDAYIYGDRVIRLSEPRQGKYYGGLYDIYYGESAINLPLYIDKSLISNPKSDLGIAWKSTLGSGMPVTLKGRLYRIKNYYSQCTTLPKEARRLPAFRLEVFEIKPQNVPAVTYISASVGWEREGERVIAHYFDMQDKTEFNGAEQRLEATREKHTHLLFNYDDLACNLPDWSHRYPFYNEMLKPWLEGNALL